MDKIDLKKELKYLYGPTAKKVVAVDVPAMNFLMVDGMGDPGTAQAFSEAIEALYPLAYTLKFMVKRGGIGIDYGVMPLEGLWWADDMAAFTAGKRDDWKWTLMIMQPEWITGDLVDLAIAEVAKKKDPPALPLIRFESFKEGAAAQILYIGPFAEEGPTIQKVHGYIQDSGHQLGDKHHEIYLSDMRRTAPERLRTILRQPMA
jgi:hypothetical protein